MEEPEVDRKRLNFDFLYTYPKMILPNRSHANILSFLLQSGLCSSSELETSRGGHIRIQHLTAAASSTSTGNCSTIGLGRHGGHGGLSCTSGSASGLMASAGGCGAEAGEMNQSRFPRLQSCAHFHYEFTDIGPISVIAPV
jgi:hypothetical protein